MSVTYTDALEALEEILQSNAWPHTLYISEDIEDEWVDDLKFNDPNQPSQSATMQSFEVEVAEEQRMVGETNDGEEVVVEL